MKITPLDIRRKEFKRSVRGYSDEEVDIFLDEVADEFERLFQENVELHDKLHRLDEQVAGHTQLREALEKTLISAQLQAEELRANAHKESELILRDAEMKARGIVSDSYGETQKTQQALVQLKMLEEDFRFKFRSLLEGYLRLLNEAPMATEPAEAGQAAAQTTPTPAQAAQTAAPTASVAAAAASMAPAAPEVSPVRPAVSPVQSPAPVTGAAIPAQPAPQAPAPAYAAPVQPAATPPVQPVTPRVAAPAASAPAAPQAAAPRAGVASTPSVRPVAPPAQRPPYVDEETPTEESDLPVRESGTVPAYYGGGQPAGPTVEATVDTDTMETVIQERPPVPGKTSDEEPLRRFFFGKRMNDVDDTFQTEDVPKKDRNREFEW